MQQLFQLSAGQTDSLHQAALQAYNTRKQVLASYWKTDSFPIMIARASRLKDSLYFTIMGPRQFQIYKDSLFVQQERLRSQPTTSPKQGQP